jgi:hypothetical protein
MPDESPVKKPHNRARQIAPLPPPAEPSLAAEAPPRLHAFLYYLVRDMLPPRYLEQIASHVQDHSYGELAALDKGLADYTERLARRLMHGYAPEEGEAVQRAESG